MQSNNINCSNTTINLNEFIGSYINHDVINERFHKWCLGKLFLTQAAILTYFVQSLLSHFLYNFLTYPTIRRHLWTFPEGKYQIFIHSSTKSSTEENIQKDPRQIKARAQIQQTVYVMCEKWAISWCQLHCEKYILVILFI